MKLVFVNRFFFPDHSATSQMLSDAAFYLADKGQDVHVVTSRSTYEGGDRLTAKDIVSRVTIHRIWTSDFGRGSLVGRSVDYMTFYLGVFLALLRLLGRGDVVIAKTDPPLLSVPVAMVAKIKGATLVNWLQDLFPEVALELGVKVPSAVVSLLIRLRNWSLQRAKSNIVISDAMRDRILKQGIARDSVVVVHNWANGELVKPVVGNNPLRKSWGLSASFVLGYSGNLGRAHEVETLLGTIRAFGKDSTVTFLFIGGGVRMRELQAKVESEAMTNCLFKPYQPRKNLSLSLGIPDVHLSILKPEMEGLILPSKIYGIFAAGKPILYIGSIHAEVAGLIEKAGIGQAVNEGDVAALIAAIYNLKEGREKRELAGINARQLFEKQFDMPLALEKLAAVF